MAGTYESLRYSEPNYYPLRPTIGLHLEAGNSRRKIRSAKRIRPIDRELVHSH